MVKLPFALAPFNLFHHPSTYAIALITIKPASKNGINGNSYLRFFFKTVSIINANSPVTVIETITIPTISLNFRKNPRASIVRLSPIPTAPRVRRLMIIPIIPTQTPHRVSVVKKVPSQIRNPIPEIPKIPINHKEIFLFFTSKTLFTTIMPVIRQIFITSIMFFSSFLSGILMNHISNITQSLVIFHLMAGTTF